MTALVIAMLLCVAAGTVVVGFVAVEARRDGREVLTEQGEELLTTVRAKSGQVVERAKDTVARS